MGRGEARERVGATSTRMLEGKKGREKQRGNRGGVILGRGGGCKRE